MFPSVPSGINFPLAWEGLNELRGVKLNVLGETLLFSLSTQLHGNPINYRTKENEPINYALC
uniref:Uncharacterized protein n=1 Tax=Anguilla anguilla TaxID=7936 RepID=A0A0E9RRU8_ANGAN